YAAERDAGGGPGRRSPGQGSGAQRRPRTSMQISPDDDSQTGPPWEDVGPPWEQPGWGGTGALAGKHPSDPLPSQRMQEGDWPDTPLAFGYADHEPGYPGGAGHAEGGYRDDAGHEADYPDSGYFGDNAHEPGYPGHEPGYPGHEPGYPGTGGHPARRHPGPPHADTPHGEPGD